MPHNFSFTSEIRYWFQYDSTKSYTLDFLGDDDVWMFVNKKLAVDIGGIHTPQAGTVTISAAKRRLRHDERQRLRGRGVPGRAADDARRRSSSRCPGFNGAVTACGPTCGDDVVTPPEQCDNGTANNLAATTSARRTASWARSAATARRPPDEECDNGTQQRRLRRDRPAAAPAASCPPAAATAWCRPSTASTCDDGTNSGGYGGCTSQCQRGAYCGDGKVAEPAGAVRRRRQRRHLRQLRRSDDAAAELQARPALRRRHRAGRVRRGVRADVVERSELHRRLQEARRLRRRRRDAARAVRLRRRSRTTAPTAAARPAACWRPTAATASRTGRKSATTASTTTATAVARPQCKLAPHCGDGMVNPPYEQCDDGVNNGPTGQCSTVQVQHPLAAR